MYALLFQVCMHTTIPQLSGVTGFKLSIVQSSQLNTSVSKQSTHMDISSLNSILPSICNPRKHKDKLDNCSEDPALDSKKTATKHGMSNDSTVYH